MSRESNQNDRSEETATLQTMTSRYRAANPALDGKLPRVSEDLKDYAWCKGKRIANGRFELAKELGAGAFGIVYLATDTDPPYGGRRDVAIKFLPSDGQTHVFHEALMTALPDHENVARVLEPPIAVEDGWILVMEYYKDGDLRQHIGKRGNSQLDESWYREVAEILRQIAVGVQAIHAANFPHLDLKPENILSDGIRWRVSDFGLTIYATPEKIKMAGTPLYMSPEQWRGDLRPPADLWAIGAIAYELLTGHQAFAASHRDDIRCKIENGDFDPNRFAAVPKELASICRRLMDTSPGQRMLPHDVIAELDRWLAITPSRSIATEEGEQVSVPRLSSEDAVRLQAPFSGCSAVDGHEYLLTYRHQLFGRREEGETLDRWILRSDPATAAKSTLCIWSWGGTGKSRLAWEWFNRSESLLRKANYEGALWCTFYVDNFNLSDFVKEALKFVTGKSDFDFKDRSPDVLLNELLQELCERRFLFVLDGLERKLRWYQLPERYPKNVEPPPEARIFVAVEDQMTFERLVKNGNSKFMITSRLLLHDLEKEELCELAHSMELKKMSGDGAVELWRSIAVADDTQRDKLIAMLGRIDFHPLAIAIIARRVHDDRTFANWKKNHPGTTALDAEFEGELENRVSMILYYALEDITGIDRSAIEDFHEVLSKLYMQKKPPTRDELLNLLKESQIDGPRLDTTLDALFDRLMVGRDKACSHFEAHPVVRSYIWNRLKMGCRPEDGATVTRADQRITVVDNVAKDMDTVRTLIDKDNHDGRNHDQAWQIISDSLFEPLRNVADGGRPELLRLMRELMPRDKSGEEAMGLPLLSLRKQQAECLRDLSLLYAEVGEPARAATANRWASAIFFQLADYPAYLDCRRRRTWELIYSGKLKEAAEELSYTVADAREKSAYDVIIPSMYFLALVAAIGGQGELIDRLIKNVPLLQTADAGKAESTTDKPHSKLTATDAWALQTAAESMLYLDRYPEALRLISLAESLSKAQGSINRGQRSWEEFTRGAAMVEELYRTDQLELLPRAKSSLRFALQTAEEDRYSIVQVLSLAYIAKLCLYHNDLESADKYLQRRYTLDEDAHYRIPACEALLAEAQRTWYVAEMTRKPEEKQHRKEGAIGLVHKALEMAYGEDQDIHYASGRRKAEDFLLRIGAPPRSNPIASAAFDVWDRLIEILNAHSSDVKDADVEQLLQDHDSENEASRLQRARGLIELNSYSQWWESTEAALGARIAATILESIKQFGADLGQFIAAFNQSSVKDPMAVLVQMQVSRLEMRPSRPLLNVPKSELESQARSSPSILGAIAWMKTPQAAHLLGVMSHELLNPDDLRIFRSDAIRRLAVDEAPPIVRDWWQAIMREHRNDPKPTVYLLAEAIVSEGLTLGKFAEFLDFGNPNAIELAFARLRLQRLQSNALGISNSTNWSRKQILDRLENVKWRLDWINTTGSARKWWEAFENENKHRLGLVLLLAEMLANPPDDLDEDCKQSATVKEFFYAYVYSNTDKIDANLCYLWYTRLKHNEERNKREARLTGKPGIRQPMALSEEESQRLQNRISELIKLLAWDATSELYVQQWMPFFKLHESDLPGCIRFLEALLNNPKELGQVRSPVGLMELSESLNNSGTTHLRAILYYTWYRRLKKREEIEKHKAAEDKKKQQPPD